jgi:hypothetical protein
MVDYYDFDDVLLMKDPRLTGGPSKKKAKKVSVDEDDHVDWDAVFEVSRVFFPYKEEHKPKRKCAVDPMDLETIEGATDDKVVNTVRRVALKVMKEGQCILASHLCRLVAEREILAKYRLGKIHIEDRDHYKKLVRSMTGTLVQIVSDGNRGLKMKWDPVLCVSKNGRWIIKRRW